MSKPHFYFISNDPQEDESDHVTQRHLNVKHGFDIQCQSGRQRDCLAALRAPFCVLQLVFCRLVKPGATNNIFESSYLIY